MVIIIIIIIVVVIVVIPPLVFREKWFVYDYYSKMP